MAPSQKQFDKASEGPQLPIFHYQGDIHLINRAEDVAPAVQELQKSNILGFDTETRPAFKKGESYLPCLLQLADEMKCYLFRLNKIGMPQEIVELLADEETLKVGVAIRDDLVGLKKRETFRPKGFIEIADLAKEQGHHKLGLRSLAEVLMEVKVSKKMRTSNWEKKELTPQQLAYAAADAHLGLKLYQILKKNSL
jgi:ribonuclease D